MIFFPIKFSAILALYYINTANSEPACCTFKLTEGDCTGTISGSGDACEWFPTGDPYFVDGIHCRGPGWKVCQDSVVNCPPPVHGISTPNCIPETSSPPNISPPNTPQPTLSTIFSPPYTQATVPGPVGDEIDADKEDTCQTNSVNCWTDATPINADYSPNSIQYHGAYFHAPTSSCCYIYKSIYTANQNCDDKSPVQSHFMMQLDCDSENFSFHPSMNAQYTAYGLDGSTCYTGIKFDVGCDAPAEQNGCDYEVCIAWDTAVVPHGQCHATNGWVMVKAGNVFSFNALDGIPTCVVPAQQESILDVIQQSLYDSESGSVNYFFVLSATAVMVILIYVTRKIKNNGYKKIDENKSGNKEHVDNYNTFNKI